jgi:hypothetical protein
MVMKRLISSAISWTDFGLPLLAKLNGFGSRHFIIRINDTKFGLRYDGANCVTGSASDLPAMP